MTTVKVKFIDEEKVLSIQTNPIQNPFATLGCGISSLTKKNNKVNSILSNDFLPIFEEEDLTEELEAYCKPTELVETANNNIEFGFQTPNKRGSMFKKADSAIQTKSVESSKLCISPKTPKTPKLNRVLGSPHTPTTKTSRSRFSNTTCAYTSPLTKNSGTPVNTPSRLSSTCDVLETPYSLRKNIKKGIANVLKEDSDEEGFDDDNHKDYSFSESNDSDTDDSEELYCINDDKAQRRLKSHLKSHKPMPRTPLRTPRRGRQLKVDVDMEASADSYFEHNSEANTCLTSDHTLNRLEKPRLGSEALKFILENRIDNHQNERKQLTEDYITLFPHWITLLSEGFSLFLCGVGSKKNLLSLFQEEVLRDFDHLVINGFFPSLTIKSIFVSILEEILDLSSYPLNLVDQLKIIVNHYNEQNNDPLFLVVNNLDGEMLRNEKAQYYLSQLASSINIHVIASLDHINSPLIFDGNKYSLYNPLWWDATSLEPYVEETSYENSLLVQQTGGLVLSSLIHVFKSLTPNAKGIFILLSKYQLNEKSCSSTYMGMSFGNLYQRCRESFFVNSDLTLRAQLTEFKDHKLIKLKRGFDGTENLLIPLEDSTLQEFLDQFEES